MYVNLRSIQIAVTKEYKYLRPGHVNLDRLCDKLVIHAASSLPGTGELPSHWSWESQESFLERYASLGSIVWAKTASYHLLMINGKHIFRMWTDSPNYVLTDLCDELAADLKDMFSVVDIPVSTYRKTKPMTKRTRLESTRDVEILLLQTIMTFGLV